MDDDNDLHNFLKKVDEIGSIISDLNTENESVSSAAIQKADLYLDTIGENNTTIHNRTVINKDSKSCTNVNKVEMSQDDFMKSIEKDAKECAEKRKENMKQAIDLKNKGNNYFKEQDYLNAKVMYTEAIHLIPDNVVFYANRAQAYLYLEDYESAIKDCDIGMKIDSKFIKCYIRKGKALISLSKYDEAITTFRKILTFDETKNKMVTDYVQEIKSVKQLKQKETDIMGKLLTDPGLYKVHNLMKSITENENKIYLLLALEELSKNLNITDHKILFCLLNGFDIIENNNFFKNAIASQDHLDVTEKILNLFTVAVKNHENNCLVVSNKDVMLNLCIQCITTKTNLSIKSQALQLLELITKFENVRMILIKKENIKSFVQIMLEGTPKNDDIALIALKIIKKFSIDDMFIKNFDITLRERFLPAVLKSMEITCCSRKKKDVVKFEKFLPVVEESISIIINLFTKDLIRQNVSHLNIWKISYNVLQDLSEDYKTSAIKFDIVLSLLGMLTNLSVNKSSFNQDASEEWIVLIKKFLTFQNNKITKRCCCLLSRVLENNDEMLDAIVKNDVDIIFINIIKDLSFLTSRIDVSKCLALCINNVEKERWFKEKYVNSLSIFLKLLSDNNEKVVGNIALCFTGFAKIDVISEKLINKKLIELLLKQATNKKLSKPAQYNCALAISRFTTADESYLQQLRKLHGLEILHSVMKENKVL